MASPHERGEAGAHGAALAAGGDERVEQSGEHGNPPLVV
jgi:hypothetical protein